MLWAAVQFIFVWLFCHMAMPANAARHLRALALAVAGARLRRYPGQTLSAFAARRRRARRMQGVVKDTDRFFCQSASIALPVSLKCVVACT